MLSLSERRRQLLWTFKIVGVVVDTADEIM